MKDLYSNVVEQYAKDWKRLGLELGLEDYEVDIISANNEYHSNKVVVCSIAILERWLRVASSPTWGKLDDAIKKIKKSKTGPMLTDSSASTGMCISTVNSYTSNASNSCNIGKSALPDMYTQCPRACSA